MTDLNCWDCGDVIGKFEDSGAPFNHMYYCTSCADKRENTCEGCGQDIEDCECEEED